VVGWRCWTWSPSPRRRGDNSRSWASTSVRAATESRRRVVRPEGGAARMSPARRVLGRRRHGRAPAAPRALASDHRGIPRRQLDPGRRGRQAGILRSGRVPDAATLAHRRATSYKRPYVSFVSGTCGAFGPIARLRDQRPVARLPALGRPLLLSSRSPGEASRRLRRGSLSGVGRRRDRSPAQPRACTARWTAVSKPPADRAAGRPERPD
jgi:hypothetical protein